jgi:hypothetical protein
MTIQLHFDSYFCHRYIHMYRFVLISFQILLRNQQGLFFQAVSSKISPPATFNSEILSFLSSYYSFVK